MAKNITSRIRYLDISFNYLTGEDRLNAVYVEKEIHSVYWKYNFVKKEVYWLEKMRTFDRTPNVINAEENIFIMDYAGVPITRENLPNDWKNQYEYILDSLQQYGCSHNDIKRGEILIKNGKIHLIDFQHATHGREEFFKGEHKIPGIMKRQDRKSFEVELGKLSH